VRGVVVEGLADRERRLYDGVRVSGSDLRRLAAGALADESVGSSTAAIGGETARRLPSALADGAAGWACCRVDWRVVLGVSAEIATQRQLGAVMR